MISIRVGDRALYVSSIKNLVPWFFILDHPNYARWISVYINDIELLETTNPDLKKAFDEGLFSSQKTLNQFSKMAHDQCHEQLNCKIKGDGGAIGILENENALKRWMVAGPQAMQVIDDFKCRPLCQTLICLITTMKIVLLSNKRQTLT